MLAVPIFNSFGWRSMIQTGVDATPGTSITPGVSNAEGSWTVVATGAQIEVDIYKVEIILQGTAVGVRNNLLDFGWDPAGGTTYVAWMSNLVCGGARAVAWPGRSYHFPTYIPAGSQVAIRIQGSSAAGNPFNTLVAFYGKRSRPELWPGAAYSETIGTITNTLGVAFTPGNAADGTWVSLGTTTKRCWWWQLGVQVDDLSQQDRRTRIQLAVGDATNRHIIIDHVVAQNSDEEMGSSLQGECMWDVPAGSELWVRGYSSGAPDTGWNAVAVGFG